MPKPTLPVTLAQKHLHLSATGVTISSQIFFLGKCWNIEHRPLPVGNGNLRKSLWDGRRPSKLGVGRGIAREDSVGTE